ncbi:hypothetical protein BC830DRAFT_1135300 [Chytriomyces sp. MP71]|nr:hypothetical protein BC830DRAFT_1135300 [Chytriomyces sp. MP71]
MMILNRAGAVFNAVCALCGLSSTWNSVLSLWWLRRIRKLYCKVFSQVEDGFIQENVECCPEIPLLLLTVPKIFSCLYTRSFSQRVHSIGVPQIMVEEMGCLSQYRKGSYNLKSML